MRNKFTIIAAFLFCILYLTLQIQTADAVYDPLSVPNNRFGIHILSASTTEASPAASLVNSNGDWGYVTVILERKDRKELDKWQTFFNELRRKHLIPIVRLTTQPEGNLPAGRQGFWKRPEDGEENLWADFLDKLIWPTKNRYVVIYNEPNSANEWGNQVDGANYATVLSSTIDVLKQKNQDFFVLNAGFDASAPSKLPAYQDQVLFMTQMQKQVPGIFNKLDGWVSHSYPNPGFISSPDLSGRGTVRTWAWEYQILRSLGVIKILPIFITETGWKHAEGLNQDPLLPSAEVVAEYYKKAFESVWANERIVAVTPFVLDYQQAPFDHFSFKKLNSGNSFYPQFKTIQDMSKVSGRPIQETKAQLTKGRVYGSIVLGESYNFSLTYKNTGQSIWNEYEKVKLIPLSGARELGIETVEIPVAQKIEPNQEYTFNIKIKAPAGGSFRAVLALYQGDSPLEVPPFEFTTEVKSPVVLEINASLKWKKTQAGEYMLKVNNIIKQLLLNSAGSSENFEARALLPDTAYDFTLEKPYYHPKTIHQTVYSGGNNLDFGELQPDIPSAILKPDKLWQLLPLSN